MPSEKELESIRILINNKPIDDFMGLSSNEMHSLLYNTFEPASPLKICNTIPDNILDQVPFFRLTEEFLKIIQRDKHIKLTPLGALPKKVLVELYNHRLILDEHIESGISKLTREHDATVLPALHYNTEFSGLIKKQHGKLTLTKTGEKIISDRNKLFQLVLKTYTEKLEWSNMDGYPAMPIGNLGWGFTIILLLHYGNTKQLQSFYAEKYFKAFPSFIETYPSTFLTTTLEETLSRIFCLRSFDRFMLWWGFIELDIPKAYSERDKAMVKATDLLGQIFTHQ